MTGVKRAGYERQLDNRGHKVVKERNTKDDEEIEHTYYKGLNEGKLFNLILINLRPN